jgi:hypothetical protein
MLTKRRARPDGLERLPPLCGHAKTGYNGARMAIVKDITLRITELEAILEWAKQQQSYFPFVHIRDLEDMLVVKMRPRDVASYEPAVLTINK